MNLATLVSLRHSGTSGNNWKVIQVGETFQFQFARLKEAAETKRETLMATWQEIQEYRRRLQAKNIELDCVAPGLALAAREALTDELSPSTSL